MTSKELLYVEDALAHEQFMKKCCCNTQLQDANLTNYMKDLEQKHIEIFNEFFNLL